MIYHVNSKNKLVTVKVDCPMKGFPMTFRRFQYEVWAIWGWQQNMWNQEMQIQCQTNIGTNCVELCGWHAMCGATQWCLIQIFKDKFSASMGLSGNMLPQIPWFFYAFLAIFPHKLKAKLRVSSSDKPPSTSLGSHRAPLCLSCQLGVWVSPHRLRPGCFSLGVPLW